MFHPRKFVWESSGILLVFQKPVWLSAKMNPWGEPCLGCLTAKWHFSLFHQPLLIMKRPVSAELCYYYFSVIQILRLCWKQAGALHFFCRLVSQRERGDRRRIHLSLPLGDFHRLLLTCVSHQDVCSLWLQRIQQQASVCSNLCFIMSSSTNSTPTLTVLL